MSFTPSLKPLCSSTEAVKVLRLSFVFSKRTAETLKSKPYIANLSQICKTLLLTFIGVLCCSVYSLHDWHYPLENKIRRDKPRVCSRSVLMFPKGVYKSTLGIVYHATQTMCRCQWPSSCQLGAIIFCGPHSTIYEKFSSAEVVVLLKNSGKGDVLL